MHRLPIVVATAVSLALLVCSVAVADTVTTSFENFSATSVNGQHGWKSAPPGAIGSCNPDPTGGHYDQAVVDNGLDSPLAFGQRSLRMSNLCGSGEFHYQTYSAPVSSPAGETLTNTVYDAQFAFISKTPNTQQPGLFMTVSPDSYEGSRMAWVSLADEPNGIHVWIQDVPGADGNFEQYDAGVLDRAKPHTIRFWIKLNPGDNDDVVRVFIDGNDVGQELGTCFTTWETYYRQASEQAPSGNLPPDLNSLEFRTSVQGPAELEQTGGFLFDNVTTTTATGPGPGSCPGEDGGTPPTIVIDKKPPTAFVAPGQRVTYQISVRNRGHAPVRGLRACDLPPRALRFVRARPHLSRAAGRRLCLMVGRLRPGQRKTFRATFELRADVTADTVTNGAIADIPAGSRPSRVPPERPVLTPRRRRIARTLSKIRVVKACGAVVNPVAHAAC